MVMAFINKFRGILEVKDTPHRIALSFASGIFWGMSPLLGIHTIGAFFTAWLFGLNRFVAIVGVYITNPWTIIPIYSFSLWVGTKLIGMKRILPETNWNDITFMYLINKFKHLILPFFVGTFTVGILSSIASYFIVHRVVSKYKSRLSNY
jgi:hypothetical protein